MYVKQGATLFLLFLMLAAWPSGATRGDEQKTCEERYKTLEEPLRKEICALENEKLPPGPRPSNFQAVTPDAQLRRDKEKALEKLDEAIKLDTLKGLNLNK